MNGHNNLFRKQTYGWVLHTLGQVFVHIADFALHMLPKRCFSLILVMDSGVRSLQKAKILDLNLNFIAIPAGCQHTLQYNVVV